MLKELLVNCDLKYTNYTDFLSRDRTENSHLGGLNREEDVVEPECPHGMHAFKLIMTRKLTPQAFSHKTYVSL